MTYDPQLFNVSPYFDDFDPEKGYYRILFRPGVAVQARELTQLQTALQAQIASLGDHIFRDGSSVVGSEVSAGQVFYSRIGGITGTGNLSSIVGSVFTNDTFASGITAETSITADAAGGNLGTSFTTEKPSIQIQAVIDATSGADPFSVVAYTYTNIVPGASGDLSPNDVFSGTADDGSAVEFSITGPSEGITGESLLFKINSGIRYLDGFFVYHTEQSFVPYDLVSGIKNFDNPNVVVGLHIDRSIITNADDSTLLDPANGTPNFNAPGADRFSIALSLSGQSWSPTVSGQDTTFEDFETDNFSPVAIVEEGNVRKIDTFPRYREIENTLARRTFDESGNYTVRAFPLDVRSDGVSGDELRFVLGEGKAYVFGFEFDSQTPTSLRVPRAREDSAKRSYVNLSMNTSIGNFVNADYGTTAVFGSSLDFESQPNFLLSAGAAGTTFDRVGSARVRQITEGISGDVLVHLSEISLDDNRTFTEAQRLFRDGATGNNDAVFTFSATGQPENPNGNSLLFPIPQSGRNNTIEGLNYSIWKPVYREFATSTDTLNVVSDFGLPNSTDVKFPGAIGTQSAFPSNRFVAFKSDGTGLTGTVEATGSNAEDLSISFSSGETGGYLLTRIDIEDDDASIHQVKTATQTTAETVATPFQVDSAGRYFVYLNGAVDVISVDGVSGNTGAGAFDATDLFEIDSNAKNNLYDWSKLVLKDENIAEYGTGSSPLTGNLTVNYTSYVRSAQGPFTVDSYIDGGVTFSDIPFYTDKVSGELIDLRNVLDFRPDRDSNGSVTGGSNPADFGLTGSNYMPYYGQSTSIDFETWLSRTDKVILTKNRRFGTIRGTYSENPTPPADREDAMTLYCVTLNPYTYDDNDVVIKYVDNRRYTMRDIGEIDKRITALEYEFNLLKLELEARDEEILDANGNPVPKNGIIVDPFVGHNIGDTTDLSYNCSIDFTSRYLRPSYDQRNVTLGFRYDVNLQPNAAGRLYADPNSGLYYYNQTIPVELDRSAGSNRTQFTAPVEVSPIPPKNIVQPLVVTTPSDPFYDRSAKPTIVINETGIHNAWKDQVTIESHGSRWRDWEDHWFGRDVNGGANLLDNSDVYDSIKELIGNRVVDLSIKFFVRPQTIVLNLFDLYQPENALPAGSPLSPTQYKVFIDGIDLTSNITGIYDPYASGPAPSFTFSSGEDQTSETPAKFNLGYATFNTNSYTVNNLLTENLRQIITVDIPKNTVPAGKKLIRVTNAASFDADASHYEDFEGVFDARGAVETRQENNVTAIRPVVQRRPVASSEFLPNSPEEVFDIDFDGVSQPQLDTIKWSAMPLAQTFSIPLGFGGEYSSPAGVGGFVHGIQLAIENIPDTGTPLIAQIRPVVNGFPHPSKIVPFSETVVRTSFDGSITNSTSPRLGLPSPQFKTGANTTAELGDIIGSSKQTFGRSNCHVVFPVPIYLEAGVEYAICLLCPVTGYKVGIKTVGEPHVTGSVNLTTGSNPYENISNVDASGVFTTQTGSDIARKKSTMGRLFIPKSNGEYEGDDSRELACRIFMSRFVKEPTQTVTDPSTGTEYEYAEQTFSLAIGEKLPLFPSGESNENIFQRLYKPENKSELPQTQTVPGNLIRAANVADNLANEDFDYSTMFVHATTLEPGKDDYMSAITNSGLYNRLGLNVNDLNGIGWKVIQLPKGGTLQPPKDININTTISDGTEYTIGLRDGNRASYVSTFELQATYRTPLQLKSKVDGIQNGNIITTLTPMLDVSRVGMVLVSDSVNNNRELDSAEIDYNGELEPNNNAIDAQYQTASRYITKQVTIPNGFTSERIRVTLDANIPEGTEFDVFARIQATENDDDFADNNYFKLALADDSAAKVVSPNTDEYQTLSFESVAEQISESFNVFSIKIVFYGNQGVNNTNIPKIKNLKAYALVE